MDVTHRIRIALAAGLALAAAGSIVLADGVIAGSSHEELFPDLKTVAPGGISLALHHHTKNDTTILRLSNKIANAGRGPLELYSQPATGPCIPGDEFPDEPYDLDANQRIYEDSNDNGHFDESDQVLEDVRVGCFEYHIAHNHWHFQDFSQYSLADVKTGEQLAGPSRKIGFCILDGERRYPGLPGSPEHGVYPEDAGVGFGCGFGDPDGGPGAMGLSVGYADVYTYSLPGQRLDISGVPAGTYCLVSTANPVHSGDDPTDIIESTHANNARRRQIEIDPAHDAVRWAGEGCPAPKSRG